MLKESRKEKDGEKESGDEREGGRHSFCRQTVGRSDRQTDGGRAEGRGRPRIRACLARGTEGTFFLLSLSPSLPLSLSPRPFSTLSGAAAMAMADQKWPRIAMGVGGGNGKVGFSHRTIRKSGKMGPSALITGRKQGENGGGGSGDLASSGRRLCYPSPSG